MQLSPTCKAKWGTQFAQFTVNVFDLTTRERHSLSSGDALSDSGSDKSSSRIADDPDLFLGFQPEADDPMEAGEGMANSTAAIDAFDLDSLPGFADNPPTPVPDVPHTSQSVPTMEEEDIDMPGQVHPDVTWVDQYPIEAYAGAVYERGEPGFERIKREEAAADRGHWGPFADEDEWGLAEWLIRNVSQTETDKFLKLGIVRQSPLSCHCSLTTVSTEQEADKDLIHKQA